MKYIGKWIGKGKGGLIMDQKQGWPGVFETVLGFGWELEREGGQSLSSIYLTIIQKSVTIGLNIRE